MILDISIQNCKSCAYYKEAHSMGDRKVCIMIDDRMTQHYSGYFMPPEDFSCSLWKAKNPRDARLNKSR